MNCGQTSYQGSSGRQIEVQSNEDSASCRTGLTTALSIIGGVTAGAALMYLLDPEEGPQRRHRARDLASNAFSATGSALGSGWHKVKDTAGRVYEAAGEGASAFGETLSHGAEYATDNRYAKALGKSARRAKAEAGDRFSYLMHGRRPSAMPDSPLAQVLCFASLVGLGAGAMYFTDPRDGARRRAVFRDKLVSAFGHMSDRLSKQGRNLYNHATGMVHEMRSKVSREQVDDRTIRERIRATMGRYVDNVGAIVVDVTDGAVVLRGPVMASQLNGLLRACRGIRGVRSIDNQLDVSTQAGSVARENSFTGRRGTSGQSSAAICPPGSTSTSQISI